MLFILPQPQQIYWSNISAFIPLIVLANIDVSSFCGRILVLLFYWPRFPRLYHFSLTKYSFENQLFYLSTNTMKSWKNMLTVCWFQLCLFRIDEKALRSENVIKEVEATMLKGTSIQIIWKTFVSKCIWCMSVAYNLHLSQWTTR
jgi:hypothetical protein